MQRRMALFAACAFCNWSIEDKAGQLLVIGYRSPEQVREIKPSGVILFSWSLKNPTQSHKLIQDIKNEASQSLKAPLFIGTDHEGGKVLRLRKGLTVWPDAASFGAIPDPNVAFRVGKDMGVELASLGFNTNLAPVLDLGNARSFLENRIWGETWELTSENTNSFIRGLQYSRIMPVGKHYPGHGWSAQDAHFQITTQNRDLSELKNKDLKPFEEAIAVGIPALMTAHVTMPKIDRLPASLSPLFLSKILKEDLKFQGLIFSDDVEMASIRAHPELKNVPTEDLALQSLKAGTDQMLVVWSTDLQLKIRDRIVRAIKEGELSEEWLNEKLARIENTKKKYVSEMDQRIKPNPFWADNIKRPEYESLAWEISQRAMRWQTPNEAKQRKVIQTVWNDMWYVVLPTDTMKKYWNNFRPQDEVHVASKRPSWDLQNQLFTNLENSLSKGRPVLVMTPPRASSHEESFQKIRLLMAKYAFSAPGLMLWVHEGLMPVNLRTKDSAIRMGLVTLYGSSGLHLKALKKYLEEVASAAPTWQNL